MSNHHHDHGHHGHDHGHDHAGHDHSDEVTPALQTRLYDQIDFDAIVTLNESPPKAGAAIVKKTWEQRLEEQPELESDADEQLLMTIPSVFLPTSFSLLSYPAIPATCPAVSTKPMMKPTPSLSDVIS